MTKILNIILNIYNKFVTSDFLLYLLFINIIVLFYLFMQLYNNFFRILIAICFVFNVSIILAYLNADFFGAFLLVAELPISMILIIFYFHKTSLKIDTIYKFKSLNNWFFVFYLLSFIFLFFLSKFNFTNSFYNYFLLNQFNTLNKNDFFIFFSITYFFNYIYVIFFAFFIFFVSFLIIIVYQINKLQLFINKNYKKNIIFLRKQNMLKQAVFKSKLKFFNKKI